MIDNFIDSLKSSYKQVLSPYWEDMTFLVVVFGILTVIIFYSMSMIIKALIKKKNTKVERRPPTLNEIVQTKDIKVSDDNDFVDILVAIEEEMSAIRELYVGGYISKGVYISETDRLYEKAKIFGL